MKKVLKFLVIIAVIAAVGAAGYFFVLPAVMGGAMFNDNIAYVTNVGNLTGSNNAFLSNRYSAVIESQEVISVDSDAEKKISMVYVKEGDSVKKGDKLFEYDIEEMNFQLEQAKLDLEQSVSEIKSYDEQIASLEKEYKTATKNQRLALENQIEAAKLNKKKSEYSKETCENSISKLEKSISNAVVKSSVDGTVKSVEDPTADAYITIISAGDFRVKASISEEHIGEFYVDEELTIRSRTNEDLTWSGKVVSIETGKPITNSSEYSLEATTRYPVYISLDTSDGLMIGQHVTVEETIDPEVETSSNMMLFDYVIVDADTDPYVWVDNNGVLEKRSISLGEYDSNLMKYEVVSGLSEDDYIAFPEDRLYEGMETARGFEDMGADMSMADDMLMDDMMLDDISVG